MFTTQPTLTKQFYHKGWSYLSSMICPWWIHAGSSQLHASSDLWWPTWRMCSIIFLETEVKLMCLKFPESFFNPFLQMEVILGFFPSSWTSPSIHNHSEIMESSFPVLSSSSQHPQGDDVRAPWRPSCWHRPHTNSSFPDNGSVCASAWGSVPTAWGPTVLARRVLARRKCGQLLPFQSHWWLLCCLTPRQRFLPLSAWCLHTSSTLRCDYWHLWLISIWTQFEFFVF